jgi:hypothetical protein
MHCAQLFMEMPHVEVKVLLLIESQHLLHDDQWHTARAGPAGAAVILFANDILAN